VLAEKKHIRIFKKLFFYQLLYFRFFCYSRFARINDCIRSRL